LVCVIVTVIVSLLTKPKTDEELKGLVYGVTDIPSEGQVPLIHRPLFWGVVVAVAFLLVNAIFW
jgi:SSS family solute:Na+ symporter